MGEAGGSSSNFQHYQEEVAFACFLQFATTWRGQQPQLSPHQKCPLSLGQMPSNLLFFPLQLSQSHERDRWLSTGVGDACSGAAGLSAPSSKKNPSKGSRIAGYTGKETYKEAGVRGNRIYTFFSQEILFQTKTGKRLYLRSPRSLRK